MLHLRRVDEAFVEEFLPLGDALLATRIRDTAKLLDGLGVRGAANEWLERMPWKRALAAALLGDLIRDGAPRRRVLEIGGGLSALTLLLAERHDYTLVEMASHEASEAYRAVEAATGLSFARIGEWSVTDIPGAADIVIANDIFPNVDQRLPEFVERFGAGGAELRLSLTYYEDIVFEVERVPSGERLFVKPWGAAEIERWVTTLRDSGGSPCKDLDQIVYSNLEGAVFTNRRNVLLARLDPLTPARPAGRG